MRLPGQVAERHILSSHRQSGANRRKLALCSYVEVEADKGTLLNGSVSSEAFSKREAMDGASLSSSGKGQARQGKPPTRSLSSQDGDDGDIRVGSRSQADRSSSSGRASSYPSKASAQARAPTLTPRLPSPSRPELSPSSSFEEESDSPTDPDTVAESMLPRWYVRQKPQPSLCLRIDGAFSSSTSLIPHGPPFFNVPPVGPLILSNSYEAFPGSDAVVKMEEALSQGFKYALRFEHVSRSPFSSEVDASSSSSQTLAKGAITRPPPDLLVFNLSK